MASTKVVVSQPQPITVRVRSGGGSGIDQFARDLANAAFAEANLRARYSFTTINVASQSDVVADSNTDTLRLIQGTGILIETDAGNDTITISATGGSAFDQFARDKANGAVQTGFTTFEANGTSVIPNSNADTIIITSTNGIKTTGNNTTSTILFELQTTGANAGSYGDSSNLVSLVIDAFGRILGISNTSPSFNVSVLTSGILSVTRGGTGYGSYTDNQVLIGNTSSGGLDKKTLTAGPGIAINTAGSTINVSSNLFPTYTKSVSYGYPLLNETITLFYTNTAITFQRVRSVVAGLNPNIKFHLLYTSDRSNTTGTKILSNVICTNTTTGQESLSFDNASVPANSFIILHAAEISGTIEELALTTFFY